MRFTLYLLLALVLPGTPLVAQSGKAAAVATALRLARPISDHMVLQQGSATTIWGRGEAGAEVSVEFAGQSKATKVGADGKWSLQLDPLPMSKEGRAMTIVSAGESLTLEDILVGEVWMCSGQSNMEGTVERYLNGPEEVAAANHPGIRLFNTPPTTAAEARDDTTDGEWRVCSPETVGSFSAVGYYFGRELYQSLDVPIGLINTAWGGKPSEAFTTRAKLESIPVAAPLLAEWDAKLAAWDEKAALDRFEKALASWEERVAAIRARDKEKGTRTRLPRRPVPSVRPDLEPNAPAAIYHQMIAPWTRYAIAGAIWYQGESNAPRAAQYGEIFPAMIEDWREQWQDETLPFYLVQLANFRAASTEPGTPSAWAELQDAQTRTLRLPHTGIAIINDIGDAGNVHPRNKQDVGKRLARWALTRDYGKEIGPVSGPLFKSHAVEGKTIRVTFDHAGDGLKLREDDQLNRFEIAGEDRKWVWAEARIGGKDNVVVSGPEVEAPVAVRYAWAANPEGANLVNSAGLPASLFRTDDWPLLTAGVLNLEDAGWMRSLATLDKRNESLRKAGWTILFDGKSLEGWTNPYDHGVAEVVAGEIRLTADKKFFLATEKTYKDFMFTAELRLPEGQANSGVMFRAHVEPGKVYGYQAECDGSDRRWSGGLYDEGRRKWIWPSKSGNSQEAFLAYEAESQAHFAKPEVRDALKRTGWNNYMIVCRGDSIRITVNGVETTSINDSLDAEGHFAIQHHGEDGQVYRFRNIMVKELK